jgi:glycosyltransferase involved in cell wall biosynthesis
LPKLAILLCTFQGESFIRPQLDSILAQTVDDWVMWVSDDGSTDETIAILTDYSGKLGGEKLIITKGPARGFAANFFSLMFDPDISADYYAFADQDDIWEPHKLRIAIDELETIPDQTPAVYCSRTKLIDDSGKATGYSPLCKRLPGFNNALVQNLASGNTMVFNNAARNLVRQSVVAPRVPYHDWWLYLLVSAAGGVVFYDNRATVRYRQHDSNQIGINSNFQSYARRARSFMRSDFRCLLKIHLAELDKRLDRVSTQNRQTLNLFKKFLNSNFISRVLKIKKLGLYRQNTLQTLVLNIVLLRIKI